MNGKAFRTFFERVKRFYGKDGYAFSITIALAIAFALLVYSYIAFMRPNEYISFYILDEHKTAVNYPEILVIGENNTCKLWITIENHMGKSITCKVLVKITDKPIQSIPIQMESNQTYLARLNEGEKWEELLSITFSKTGKFKIIFELWIYNEKTGNFEYSQSLVLSLTVVEA